MCNVLRLCVVPLYTASHKSLQDFRTLRYGSRDGHAEGEHVNRGRDTKQKLGEILCLLICPFLLCLSWLLCSRVWNFRRDLGITLYADDLVRLVKKETVLQEIIERLTEIVRSLGMIWMWKNLRWWESHGNHPQYRLCKIKNSWRMWNISTIWVAW